MKVKADGDTSKAETKTPKRKKPKTEDTVQETKTPKESKTPKEAKTPKQDSKTPKQEPKTPKQDAKTPKDVATPGKTPKRTVKGGIQVEDLKEGNGEEVK